MNSDSLKYRIGLTLLKGIGNKLAKSLIAYTGSEEAIFRENPKALSKIPGIGDVLLHEITNQNVLHRAEQEIEFINKNKINPLFFTDRDFPFRLKECPDSPILIYTKGNLNLNTGKFVSVVGTRNATEYGKDLCKELIHGWRDFQIIVVSGLAYGIDICAHKTALENNLPTIAVPGHGLDRIYPATHRSTAVKIIDNGMILTEYTSGTNPDRQNFVQRNRIIAGLCDATVVVESANKGGALITAELANDYNRDVFAFPGRTNDQYSAGCNLLIRQNKASLIESSEDFIRFMGWESENNTTKPEVQTSLFQELTPLEQQVFTTLRQKTEGLQVNELSINLGQPVSRISAILLGLEFSGMVKCLPGNLYKALK